MGAVLAYVTLAEIGALLCAFVCSQICEKVRQCITMSPWAIPAWHGHVQSC